MSPPRRHRRAGRALSRAGHGGRLHAVGFVGTTGAGTPELFGVQDRVDIVTGTLGKAMGGASGGYAAAHAEIVEMLRQRSRPYLFSNSLAPSIAAAGIATLDLLETSASCCSGYVRTLRTSAPRWLHVSSRFPNLIIRSCRS